MDHLPTAVNGRIKFQVWSEGKKRWRTVYVRAEALRETVIALKGYGFKIRIGGDRAGI